MKNRIATYCFLGSVLALLFSACSVKKKFPEEEYLYTEGRIELTSDSLIQQKKKVQKQVDKALFPEPNSAFLGMRPGLYFYYKMQKDKPGFINRFFYKRIGEEPVYFSNVNIENTKEVIANRLENLGFFYNEISHNIQKDSANKKAQVVYKVELKEPYRLNNFELEAQDSLQIYDDIKSSLAETEIKEGMRFNLEIFKNERERINKYLKERGYYNFNPNFLLFEADTNKYSNRKFDLFLRIKNEVPDKSLSVYKLNELTVFPDARINDENQDTIHFEALDFVQDEIFFKPKRLRPYILLEPGQKYSSKTSKLTSKRLSSLQTYKFVNIDYEEVETDSSNTYERKLNANISLSPMNKRSLLLEIQGLTKSNNFTGPNLGVTYINRNIFKAGESIRINANGGYERQFLSGDQNGLSSISLGLRTSFTIPRLIFPIDLSESFEYSIPKTTISAGVDYLNRTNLYTLNSVSTSFGYNWEGNKYTKHTLNPVSIEYLSLGDTSDEFEEILDNNPFLRRSFDQQFIAGLTYNFTYNAINDQSKGEGFFFNFGFDVAGNTLSLLDKNNPDGNNTFLDLAYAQYARTDVELRYHYAIDNNGQKLVARVFGGFGLPYGNSDALPFVKQYFAGGPYSVRSFRIRSLGPGTYQPQENTTSFFDQAGDIRLEANIEYRFPIFEYLNGAIFTDAGNVWLRNENPALPGGKFSSDFIRQFGIGSGVGLRVDIQGFVIRLDLAAPLKRPTESWNFEYDKPVLNFAIGYSF
ncbi:MAG: BamA/TamA family outer membrane protein [Bacteroidota bacterium]